MNFKIISRFQDVVSLNTHPRTIKNRFKVMLESVFCEGMGVPHFKQFRFYAEKPVEPEKRGKEEKMTVKMPGFVTPETINDEGYFTQKAKQQLEEMKKRGLEKPDLINPEKKD